MEIVRRSPHTGQLNRMSIDVTPDQIAAWKNGMLIQDAMPQLSRDECEFIKTGFTPEDWEDIFNRSE